MQTVKIRENSFWARIAAWKLGAGSVAMVLGKTIHLFGASQDHFLQNEAWVRHELVHIEQFRRLGWFKFVVQYLWFSYKFGYFENPLEVEARNAELNTENITLSFENIDGTFYYGQQTA